MIQRLHEKTQKKTACFDQKQYTQHEEKHNKHN